MINILFLFLPTPGDGPRKRDSVSTSYVTSIELETRFKFGLRRKDNLTACDYFGNDFQVEHGPQAYRWPTRIPCRELQVETLATWMRDNEKYWKTMWNMMWNITQIISWKTSRNILGNIIKFIGNKIILYFRKTNWPILCETLWNIHKNIDQSISWNKHVKQHEISTNKSWNKTWNIYAQINDKHLMK